MSSLQMAYHAGKNKNFEHHVAAHYYLEYDIEDIDVQRLQNAIDALIKRHDALRIDIQPDGRMCLLENVPSYPLYAWQNSNESDVQAMTARSEAVRKEMAYDEYIHSSWPAFDMRVINHGYGRNRLHINFNLIMFDGRSVELFLKELGEIYANPDVSVEPAVFRYETYKNSCDELISSKRYLRSKDYWWGRVASLPRAPDLPHVQQIQGRSRMLRLRANLSAARWQNIKDISARNSVSPNAVLLTAYSLIIAAWSKDAHFLLTMMIQNGRERSPGLRDALGNFNSIVLVEIDHREERTFLGSVQMLHKQILKDILHADICGLEVLKQINRAEKAFTRPASTVAFVSTLKEPERTSDGNLPWLHIDANNMVYSSLETPQVWLDHQASLAPDNSLVLNWDFLDNFFPCNMINEMFDSYCELLERLADSDATWGSVDISLIPSKQIQITKQANQTSAVVDTRLLHELFFERVLDMRDSPAILSPKRTLTYGELAGYVYAVSESLHKRGMHHNELVAVMMDKGWEQVAAVLGILAAGGAYVPIDPSLPEERKCYLLSKCEVRHVLTQSKWAQQILPLMDAPIVVDQLAPLCEQKYTSQFVRSNSDLAYVIFTSGSTGTPKGVALDHCGPVNTILDINKRFKVDERDRVFCISSLSFDLSVYDIFGTLAAGATLVLPDPNLLRDVAHWLETLVKYQVTIWNSAPALMQMLIQYIKHQPQTGTLCLRQVMLSGDWVQLNIFDDLRRIDKSIHVSSLGGATEASIWSICHDIVEVNPVWSSIPYGRPLANQSFHILDKNLRDRPIWVTGDIYIGGIGLAQGYWADPVQTEAAFIRHPRTGVRLYRTGDIGRYLPNGEIEFLGREDFQVKVQGYRVELGEIESALLQNTNLTAVTVVVCGERHEVKTLMAYVVLKKYVEVSEKSIKEFVASRLPGYMVPSRVIFLDQIPVNINGKIDRKSLPKPATVHRPGVESGRPTSGSVEEKILQIWCKVLKLDEIGLNDNFFELGGDSFAALMLIVEVKDCLGFDLPLSMLIEDATVAELAVRIKECSTSMQVPSATCMVRLKRGNASAGSLFLVHPSGGTVMCYNRLADQLVGDASIYAMQAFGAIKGFEPDTSVQDMASRYNQVMMESTNGGPYRLAGWSFGGVVAMEMAHQLMVAGRTVESIVLLDVPAPLEYGSIDDKQLISWFFMDLIGDGAIPHEGYVAQLGGVDELLSSFLVAAQSSGKLSEDLSVIDLVPLFRVFAANLRALRAYRPVKLSESVRVLNMKAQMLPPHQLMDHPGKDKMDWGWGVYLPKSVKTISIPGDHYTIIKSPHVNNVARCINDFLYGENEVTVG